MSKDGDAECIECGSYRLNLFEHFDNCRAKERALAALIADRDRLAASLAASEREADRLRHGVPVEGDFVCPDSLRADRLAGELEQLKAAHRGLDGFYREEKAIRKSVESQLTAARALVGELVDALSYGDTEGWSIREGVPGLVFHDELIARARAALGVDS